MDLAKYLSSHKIVMSSFAEDFDFSRTTLYRICNEDFARSSIQIAQEIEDATNGMVQAYEVFFPNEYLLKSLTKKSFSDLRNRSNAENSRGGK